MPSSPTPPPDRTALVVAFGSPLAVVVAVQTAALVPALGIGVCGAVYFFLRL
ncbi:hypothetical protein [Streptomyces sp. NBC_00145]|uniref:hypothetical protein n=1 Tax=Streptomyces sp. NBC_00145 TaxID=2975666 RepID=UPI002E185896